ncbi:hypothetical protein ACDI16_02630 [Oceanobacillus caeni]|uniref:hypothetical protein n=1 Tax=Virgibacillus sp. SK37 TaxID=403957 RepID=UPI0011A029C0|nr:hypothetical protein [Virgibacillus sp. SK37]
MKKLLLLFVIFSIILIGCSANAEPNQERLQNIKDNIGSYDNVMKYIEDEISFDPGKRIKYKGHNFYHYTIQLKASNKFSELNKDEKYYKMVDILKTVMADYPIDDLYCETKKTGCFIHYIEVTSGEDTYTIDYEERENDYNYTININSDEEYRPDEESRKSSASVDAYFKQKENSDTETSVDNKDGNDWINLTENQKFHAVSNSLYSLDEQGYTILEGEYYYIDALDAFYSDNTTRNESVSMALASVGTMSGTIYK